MPNSVTPEKDSIKPQENLNDPNVPENQVNINPQLNIFSPKPILATLLVIVFIGIIYFLIISNNSSDNNISIAPLLITSTPIPTVTPTPTIVCPSVTPIPDQVYLLKIREKTKTEYKDIGSIYEYLNKIFKFPDYRCKNNREKALLWGISYDVREIVDNNSKYNRNVYIVSAWPIDEPKKYTDNFFTIEISKADHKLIPFIRDEKYCKVDNDCQITEAWCKDGTTTKNYFIPYLPVYGCEPPGGNGYDEKSKCSYGVEYQNPHCENNKCVGDIKTFKCISCQGDWMNERGTCATVTPVFSSN